MDVPNNFDADCTHGCHLFASVQYECIVAIQVRLVYSCVICSKNFILQLNNKHNFKKMYMSWVPQWYKTIFIDDDEYNINMREDGKYQVDITLFKMHNRLYNTNT